MKINKYNLIPFCSFSPFIITSNFEFCTLVLIDSSVCVQTVEFFEATVWVCFRAFETRSVCELHATETTTDLLAAQSSVWMPVDFVVQRTISTSSCSVCVLAQWPLSGCAVCVHADTWTTLARSAGGSGGGGSSIFRMPISRWRLVLYFCCRMYESLMSCRQTGHSFSGNPSFFVTFKVGQRIFG